MWLYEKKLEYPVKIKNPNPALAKFIISQVGGSSIHFLNRPEIMCPVTEVDHCLRKSCQRGKQKNNR